MGSMFDDNPSLIQDFDPDYPPTDNSTTSPWTATTTTTTTAKPPTPLVLIHDGGGTIFSYYCLGDLGRPVHGIANPHFESGAVWEGGLPEMARRYLGYVKAAVPDGGDVILGGWSLGGLLALEVARQLADEKRERGEREGQGLNLLGIVMVDSVCPILRVALPMPLVQHVMKFSEHTKEETRERVLRCFAEAVRMVGQWTVPEWGERREQKGSGARSSVNLGRSSLPPPPPPPPVILLRATDPVPVPDGGVTRVDVHRNDPLLGWGGYREGFITKAVDIPGHHFSIFHTEETLETTTEAIKRACLELEEMGRGRRLA